MGKNPLEHPRVECLAGDGSWLPSCGIKQGASWLAALGFIITPHQLWVESPLHVE